MLLYDLSEIAYSTPPSFPDRRGHATSTVLPRIWGDPSSHILFMLAGFVLANAGMQMCGDAVVRLSVQR